MVALRSALYGDWPYGGLFLELNGVPQASPRHILFLTSPGLTLNFNSNSIETDPWPLYYYGLSSRHALLRFCRIGVLSLWL